MSDGLAAQTNTQDSLEPRKHPLEDGEVKTLEKKQKADIPEGMSKNQWKKVQKKMRWEENKEEYRRGKRQKKKAAKRRRKEKIRELVENGDTESVNYHQLRRTKIDPATQIQTNVKIIMDCEFDEYMNEKEIASLSNQITRAYSAKRHCPYNIDLAITSFNKRLKHRFDNVVTQYHNWTNIEFVENDTLESILPKDEEERKKIVYLTADTDNEIVSVEPGYTYIIGGIVDKNRHKNICVNKATSLGLQVARLPIGKYIEINGRSVLATSHVYELCLKWFENDKDWAKAFNEVLPPRKLKSHNPNHIETTSASEEPSKDDKDSSDSSDLSTSPEGSDSEANEINEKTNSA